MFNAVEQMRIEPLPPLVGAFLYGMFGIVRNSGHRPGFVRAMAGLEPPPIARLMQRDAETQPLFARCRSPVANYIAVRANGSGVPQLVFRIPGIEAVMMIGQCDKQPRPRLLVARNQSIRVPVQQRPLRAEVLVAKARWMTIMLQVILILPLPLDVHVARIPVAILRHALRAPMRPDAELRVLIPLRRVVLHHGVPRWPVWAFSVKAGNR